MQNLFSSEKEPHEGILQIKHYEKLQSLNLEGKGEQYIMTEYIDKAVDLIDFINDTKKITETMVVDIFFTIIAAVRHMHAAGVVHKDLKPDNILMSQQPGTEKWVPKIIDFGFAAWVGDRCLKVGTGSYMAPELVFLEKNATTLDMWSIGVMLHLILAREHVMKPMPWENFRKLVASWRKAESLKVVPAEYEASIVKLKKYSKNLKDLMRGLLIFDHQARFTADDALFHPIFVLKTIFTSKVDKDCEYRFGRELGQGRMGQVFEVVGESGCRKYAMKIIDVSDQDPDNGKDELDIQNMFSTEKDQHEGILKIQHYEELKIVNKQNKYRYIMTEHVAGSKDLHDFMGDKKMTEESVVDIIFTIIDAVRHMHASGVVHKDLKPENILMLQEPGTTKWVPKIIDFGYSAYIGTSPKQPLGTPQYMAPELSYFGVKDSDKADMWSTGVMLYVALANKDLVEATNDPSDFHKRVDAWFTSRSVVPAQIENRIKELYVSEDCKDLLRKLLNIYPDARISADEALMHPVFVGNAYKRLIDAKVDELARQKNPDESLRSLPFSVESALHLLLNAPAMPFKDVSLNVALRCVSDHAMRMMRQELLSITVEEGMQKFIYLEGGMCVWEGPLSYIQTACTREPSSRLRPYQPRLQDLVNKSFPFLYQVRNYLKTHRIATSLRRELAAMSPDEATFPFTFNVPGMQPWSGLLETVREACQPHEVVNDMTLASHVFWLPSLQQAHGFLVEIRKLRPDKMMSARTDFKAPVGTEVPKSEPEVSHFVVEEPRPAAAEKAANPDQNTAIVKAEKAANPDQNTAIVNSSKKRDMKAENKGDNKFMRMMAPSRKSIDEIFKRLTAESRKYD